MSLRVLSFEEFRQQLETLFITVFELKISFEPGGFITTPTDRKFLVSAPAKAELPIFDWENTLSKHDWSALQALKLTIQIMGGTDSVRLLERYGVDNVPVALHISGPPIYRKLPPKR